jgi:Holliday junction resolvase-like predicted endonuclease
VKTTELGLQAESAVISMLETDGYEIIHRNWKTKVCEIDIVAKKSGSIYFVEVKYRSGTAQGDGFEYIAHQKIKRMSFAAEVWRQKFDWQGDYFLMAAAVSGSGYDNIELIEIN